MKFLKGLVLFILGSLLSLSLILFGISLTVNQTALNPDFVTSQVESLDLPTLAEEILSEEIPPSSDEMFQLVVEAARVTITDQEDWIKQQAAIAIETFYDYLEGRSQNLSLEIPLDEVMESLRDNLWQAVQANPPDELEGLPPDLMEQEFNQFWDEFSQEIPSTLEIDETLLEAEVRENIDLAREIIGYVNIAFQGLIALCLVLILLIILVHHQVKGSTRHLGITFLTCGIFSLAGVIIARWLGGTQLAQVDLPAAYLQTWLPQLIKDALNPLMIYDIALIVAGVILLIVSFTYRRRDEYSY